MEEERLKRRKEGRESAGERVRKDARVRERSGLTSQKVFIKLFCKSEFTHKSVNSFFILVMIKNNLTDLCGN